MNQALIEGDAGDSARAWRQAYSAALSHPGWLGLLVVATASLRLAAFAALAPSAAARARETYWIAFFRARQQRSLDGVLHAAEAFAGLGDRTTTEQCLRAAEVLATRTGDPADDERVRLSAARLMGAIEKGGAPRARRASGNLSGPPDEGKDLLTTQTRS
jgi:hypothetical protein